MLSSLSYYKGWLDVRVDPSKLSVGNIIANGGFKKVFEGTYAGEAVAVSVLNGSTAAIKKSKRKTKLLARELRAMYMLSNHPGVPRFHGYCSTSVKNEEEQIVMVSELCEHGDMASFVETAEFEGMTTRDRMMLCIDILRVLSVMHDEGIYHRMVSMIYEE